MSFFHTPPNPKQNQPQQEKVVIEVDNEGVQWVKCPNEGIRVSLQHMQLGQVVIDGSNFIKLVEEPAEIQPPQI